MEKQVKLTNGAVLSRSLVEVIFGKLQQVLKADALALWELSTDGPFYKRTPKTGIALLQRLELVERNRMTGNSTKWDVAKVLEAAFIDADVKSQVGLKKLRDIIAEEISEESASASPEKNAEDHE